MADARFRCVFRVRFAEVDAQGIVFNSRYGEYTDMVAGEYFCALFGVERGQDTIDTRLVKQTTQWRAPARFDDVIVATAEIIRVGTRSFAVRTEFRREGSDALLVEVETVYVAMHHDGSTSRPLTERERSLLERAGPYPVVDLAGPRGRS
jgi:acyl-CoA thioester hydrolase